MKILQTQIAEILEPEGYDIESVKRHIEICARTCYQSENLIREGSADKMVKRLIELNHTAMLEHGTIYLHLLYKLKNGKQSKEEDLVDRYIENPYSDVNYMTVELDDDTIEVSAYITTNYRVIIQNGWESDLKYMSEYIEQCHIKRITLRLTTNLQVAMEYLRHRRMSFAMESSRYCAYDQEKFGDEIQYILPLWITEDTPRNEVIEWMNGCQDAENHYMRLRDMGWKAEECAQMLNKATKTTLIMTGTTDYWDDFFDLRYFEKTGKAHPQAKELAEMVYIKMYGEEN